MDIAHDRAGYYLVWGCLNWVPGFYTSQPLYLTKHPVDLSATVAMAILIAGVLMIYINWEADDQRQRFRESDGQALVWGRKPEYIVAKYIAGMSKKRLCQLLVHSLQLVALRSNHHISFMEKDCLGEWMRLLRTEPSTGQVLVHLFTRAA